VVLCIKNVFAVTAPKISGDRALRFGSKQPGRAERFVHTFDVNVTSIFPWLLESQILSVRRELHTGDFGIAEDQLAVNQWWQTIGGGFLISCIDILRGQQSGGERQTKEAVEESRHNGELPLGC
jgi:hypothetical protein